MLQLKKFSYNVDNLIDTAILANPKYKNFCKSAVAVAVSGGADSVALLSLMHQWVQHNNEINPKIQLLVLTVNHYLRSEAKIEVEYVKQLSHSLGLECIALDWDNQNNTSNLQARAREGRYMLMTKICNELNIRYLAIAHHLNDYIENFCIRRSRKSGILGLSSSNINFIDNIKIIRPLFNFSKLELINYLKANNIKWFEDQSNFSSKYQRNRVRHFISSQDITYQTSLMEKLHHINSAASELKQLLIECMAESVAIHDFGIAIINLHKYKKYPFEIRLQFISVVLTIVSGNKQIPRARSIKLILLQIDELLENPDQNTLRQTNVIKTLHDCRLVISADQLLVYKELGKSTPSHMKLSQENFWDNRFRVIYDGELNLVGLENAYITNFTSEDYSIIKNELNIKKITDIIGDIFKNEIKRILLTMPVVKTLEKVVALPHMSYYDNCLYDNFTVSFSRDSCRDLYISLGSNNK